jgi:hypothetical protein
LILFDNSKFGDTRANHLKIVVVIAGCILLRVEFVSGFPLDLIHVEFQRGRRCLVGAKDPVVSVLVPDHHRRGVENRLLLDLLTSDRFCCSQALGNVDRYADETGDLVVFIPVGQVARLPSAVVPVDDLREFLARQRPPPESGYLRVVRKQVVPASPDPVLGSDRPIFLEKAPHALRHDPITVTGE